MSEASDLAYMLADCPGRVTVTIGAVTRSVPRDSSDEIVLDRGNTGVIGKTVSVVVATADFPAVKVGDAATVGGVAHTVLERLQIEDGALTRLLFKRA